MAEGIRVGIIGGGWPGTVHAKGYQDAGGYKLVAIADLIPQRRAHMMKEFGIAKQFADASDLLADKDIDAVSICLPNHLHAPTAIAALKAGKHVMCEKPPAISSQEARQMQRSAEKNQKVLMYSLQRRYGPHAQAAYAAIAKGFVGEVYHARAVWTRTRAIPQGTGWFTQKEKSGGGALLDVGIHMLDLAWYLLGQPKATTAYGVTHRKFASLLPENTPYDVDDAAFAIVRFENGKSIELATSWALNQPQNQNGAVLRIYGDKAALEVYTPQGAVLYRNFDEKGACKEHPLKPPKTINHTALMRHFRECIQGKATPTCGASDGVALMEMIEAIYKSSESGKSATV